METRDVLSGSSRSTEYAPVAQLDRAPVFGTGGWGFESLRAYSHETGQATLVVWPVCMTCSNGENPHENAADKSAFSQATGNAMRSFKLPGVSSPFGRISPKTGSGNSLAPLLCEIRLTGY